TANCSGRSPSLARLYSAGTSFRWVRSPVTPKMMIVQGSGGRERTTAGPAAGLTRIWVPSIGSPLYHGGRSRVDTKPRAPGRLFVRLEGARVGRGADDPLALGPGQGAAAERLRQVPSGV